MLKKMEKINLVTHNACNENEVFEEMECLIVEYFKEYEEELKQYGYTFVDIINNRNDTLTAMSNGIEVLFESIYGSEITMDFFDDRYSQCMEKWIN